MAMDLSRTKQKPAPSFGDQVLKKLVDYEADYRFQQKLEAEAQGVPPEQTLQTLLNIYNPQNGSAAAPGMASTGPQQAQGATNVADPTLATSSKVRTPQGVKERLFQQSGVDPRTGEVKTGGFFNVGPSMQTIKAAQEVAGEAPLQAGEREKVGLEGQKALASTIFGKQLDAAFKQQEANQKLIDSAGRVTNDLASMVNAFESIATGPIGGRIANIGEAVTRGIPGVGPGVGGEVSQQLKTISETLIFSLGEYLTGQGGRSLSDAEQERLRSTFSFPRKLTERDFVGRLQAVLTLINNRLPAGAQRLPPARKFIEGIRAQRGQQFKGTGQAVRSTKIKSVREIQ